MAKGFDLDAQLTLAIVQEARAAGYVAAGRYTKNLTEAEIQICRDEDFGLWIISEGRGDRATMQRGYEGGLHDGQMEASRLNRLNIPNNVPLASAVDFDATDEDIEAIDNYMRGFFEGVKPRPPVVYGDGDVLSSELPANTRAYVAGAGGWEGTKAFLAQKTLPALIQHMTKSMFGVGVDPVDINDESVVWFPARDVKAVPPVSKGEAMRVPEAIQSLQTSLIAAGYDLGPSGADGKWGPHTQAAIDAWVQVPNSGSNSGS